MLGLGLNMSKAVKLKEPIAENLIAPFTSVFDWIVTGSWIVGNRGDDNAIVTVDLGDQDLTTEVIGGVQAGASYQLTVTKLSGQLFSVWVGDDTTGFPTALQNSGLQTIIITAGSDNNTLTIRGDNSASDTLATISLIKL